MQLTVDTAILEAARALGPLIREHADEAEHQRRLSRPVVDALAEAGLLRLYVPKSLGGLETDPITCVRVVEEVSGFDSAAGWALMGANGIGWLVSRFPDEVAEEVYAESPTVPLATAFYPPMQAVPTDGGYRVSGRTPLSSTCHEARWFFFPTVVMDGDRPRLVDGAPQAIGTLVPAAECEIIDTWYSMGMRGSDSNDVAVHDAFVPTRRTCSLTSDFQLGRHYQGPLYRAPFIGVDSQVWGAVALALARGAIDEVCALAERKTPLASVTPLRERASAQAKVGLAEATLQSGRLLLYDTLRDAWERTLAGEPSSLQQKADLLMAGVHAMQSAVKAVELMYATAGTSGIYTRSRLERHFRDVQVLKQHGLLSESRYETVGQVRLGLPPDLAVVAL